MEKSVAGWGNADEAAFRSSVVGEAWKVAWKVDGKVGESHRTTYTAL